MHIGLRAKYRYACLIVITLELSRQFAKNVKIPNFMKILLSEAEIFHADRRTNVQKTRLDETNTRFFSILRTSLKINGVGKIQSAVKLMEMVRTDIHTALCCKWLQW